MLTYERKGCTVRTKMTYDEMKEALKKRLKPKRFTHSLGVAKTAVFLARRFGVDEEKARIAGLLHDCGREYEDSALIHEAERRGIPVSDVERAMPILLHAYIGARRVREVYGIKDAAIEQAIWRHSVGAEDMTDLDKVIWFADMIEPGRAYPEVERLRRLSREASLDAMVLEGLTQTILFVVREGHLIHPVTVAARNALLLKGST